MIRMNLSHHRHPNPLKHPLTAAYTITTSSLQKVQVFTRTKTNEYIVHKNILLI